MARVAVLGGQCIDAPARRFAKAAERQGGEAPAVRREKARCNARKSMSATLGALGAAVLPDEGTKDVCGGVSMSAMSAKDGSIAYRRLLKSLKSISRASPA